MNMLLKNRDVYGNESGVEQVQVLAFTTVNNVVVGVYADKDGNIKATSIENLLKEKQDGHERVDAAASGDSNDGATRPSGNKSAKSAGSVRRS